jgi:Flp pilus assembly protein TadD
MKDYGQITILLVEPLEVELDRLCAMLQEMGLFNYLQAENGPEALAMVNSFSPQMVIAQQETPQINGLALLRQVRRQDTPESETIFVLYGHKLNSRTLTLAGRAGVNALILMPCTAETFKSKINEAINPPKAPEDEKAEELYAISLKQIDQGQLDQALATSQSILDIHDNAEVYFNMGYIKSMKGDLEAALDCFKKATAVNGYHALAYQQIGLIYEKMGCAEDAAANLEKAAEILLEKHNDSEAEEVLNTVLELRPDTTNVYNSLGIIYRRQKRLSEALRAYEKALRVHPDDEYIYFNAARVYLDMGNTIMAQKYLRQAIKINSDFSEAIDLLRATEMGLKIDI